MGADAHLDWQRAAASALDWWADAGVDTLVDDHPRDWLAAPAPVIAAAAPAAIDLATLPATIAEYLAWRVGPAGPETVWAGEWIPATGPTDAALMVLVDCPDRDDRGGLLGGAAGLLFDRMLAAIGLTRADIHLAALCAKRPTAGRTPPDAHARLAELAQHHVALVAPQRLLVMGNAASRAILASDVAPARGRLHPLNHREGKAVAVTSFHPRFLLEKPAAKAGSWADLRLLIQDWER